MLVLLSTLPRDRLFECLKLVELRHLVDAERRAQVEPIDRIVQLTRPFVERTLPGVELRRLAA